MKLVERVNMIRLKNGKFCVTIERTTVNASIMKPRPWRLAEALGGKWSKRHTGYVIPNNELASAFVELYHEGWDADENGNMFEPGSSFVIAQRDRESLVC